MTTTGSEVARTSTEEEGEEIMDSRDQAQEVIINNPVEVVVEDTVTIGEVRMTEDQDPGMMVREEVDLTTITEEMTTEEETIGMIKEETMDMAIPHMATATVLMAMAMPGLGENQTLVLEEETILTILVLAWTTMIGPEVESLGGTMEVEVLDSNRDLLDCNLEQLCLLCSLLVLQCRSSSLEEVLEVPGVQVLTATMPTDPTT